ncbi:hypothetical protein Tco_0414642 [Tanacetum coccineum]
MGRFKTSDCLILLDEHFATFREDTSDTSDTTQATLAIPRSPIGWENMDKIQGLKEMDLKIKGLDECFKDAPPHGLEPSAYCYK